MPQGGVRLLIGGALVNLSLGSLFAWSLFVQPLVSTFDTSAATISTVFSGAVAVFATIVLVSGRAIDRLPPSRTVLLAAACGPLGLLMAAYAPSLPWLVVGYSGLFGVANGLGYASAVAVASRRFGRHRGLAVGAVVGAYAAGPLVTAPIITTVLARADWRAAMIALAIVVAGGLTIGAALLGLGERQRAAGGDRPGVGERQRAAGRDRPGVGERSTDGDRARRPRPRLTGLLLWSAFLLGTLPALMVVAHAAPIARNAGLSVAATGVAVALVGAGNLIGRTGGGWLSDRTGRLPGLRAATVGLAACCLLLPATRAAVAVLVLVTIVGVAYGVQSALVPALTADLFGTERFAVIYGRVFTAWGVAGLAGPQIGARLGDRGNFGGALLVGAAAAAAAFALHTWLGRAGAAAARTNHDAVAATPGHRDERQPRRDR
jgi:OFA family oxalate/formate antiporter-like MFS transporter